MAISHGQKKFQTHELKTFKKFVKRGKLLQNFSLKNKNQ